MVSSLFSLASWSKSGAATSSRQHAAARCESIASSGGDSARQRSSASGQRGAKRQPTVLDSALPARRGGCEAHVERFAALVGIGGRGDEQLGVRVGRSLSDIL